MKKFKIILPLLIIVIASVFFIAMKNQNYSATDVLENADFKAKNPTVTIHSINTDKEDIYTEIEIPEKTKRELIKAFQNAKFKKTTINAFNYDYRITIALNTGYAMYLDSDEKSLTIISTNKDYAIVNDSDFFSILEKATK
ncbi:MULTISPECIES: hypothetical protein [unclassified Lysinibacillus]|uniref:hypothetical protein n=1 Tax=unclassified Lysinibacillus TaxID=2636778 RepID=UPI0035D8F842